MLYDVLFNLIPLLIVINVFLFALNVLLRWFHTKPVGVNRKFKLLTVIGSGGHTMEMLKLLGGLDDPFHTRVYAISNTDKMSRLKIEDFEASRSNCFSIETIPRSREVLQSYWTSVWTTLVAFVYSLRLVWKERPDVVLCNGPGTGLPICVITSTFSLLRINPSRVIFVESICRVKSLSLTGYILYYTRMVDHILVQWPELTQKYPRANFIGRLV